MIATLHDRRMIVCCGAGGVGKTTISASIALALARGGHRVAVITIDPARREVVSAEAVPGLDRPVGVALRGDELHVAQADGTVCVVPRAGDSPSPAGPRQASLAPPD